MARARREPTQCEVETCEGDAVCKGYCKACYSGIRLLMLRMQEQGVTYFWARKAKVQRYMGRLATFGEVQREQHRRRRKGVA